MPPCGTQDDENMMVLWRRSLYWSSSSVAVLAALVVLVIFERRASPYPLHLGRGSLFVPGARFSEQSLMPPCGTQDDENMMVLWRRSLYWSSSSVAVLAALVVLVIFKRRASPYPFHWGGGGLLFAGADFGEQGTKGGEFGGSFWGEDPNKARKARHKIWRAALAAGFPFCGMRPSRCF